jgi:hypothetical protein
MTSSLPNQPNWYYARNGHQVGPVSESEIPSLINSGVVVASTLVWHEGLTDWIPANQSTLSKLFSGSTPPPPLPTDLRSGEKQMVVINTTQSSRRKGGNIGRGCLWIFYAFLVLNGIRILFF